MNSQSLGFATYRAFTESVYGGSEVTLITYATSLDSNTMQRIAFETGSPATAFILQTNSSSVTVRFFSTRTEYTMCGHGTIGLATWLCEQGFFTVHRDDVVNIELHTPGKQTTLFLSRNNDGRLMVRLRLDPVSFKTIKIDTNGLSQALGLQPKDFSTSLPISFTQSDFNHLIVPAVGLSSIENISPDFPRIEEICNEIGAHTLAILCLDTIEPSNSLHCREFCPAVGTPEAAATGTTNRALACYLFENNAVEFNDPTSATIYSEQGYEINRPSLIQTELSITNNKIVDVHVGGTATRTMDGNLYY